MTRKNTYSIAMIENILKPVVTANINTSKKVKVNGKPIEIMIDDETIFALSDRYKLFFTKGYTCIHCGLQASFFALETSGKKIMRYHLNLYGYDKNGKEVLFTKDHILPKSKGGKNHLSNYQTMCVHCNNKKGNNLSIDIVN